MTIATGQDIEAADVLALTDDSKVLSHSRVLTAASGDVAYTGYGFQPKTIIIFGTKGGSTASWGVADTNLAEMCIYSYSTDIYVANTGAIIYIDTTTGTVQSAVLKTFDADGFTLTWTKTGTPTGTDITFMVLAFGRA